MHRYASIAAILSLLTALSALAQGTGPYVNFETPVHDSILVTTVGNADYLLIANSEDNAIEVWDTTGPSFLLRVPVGLEPVTVVEKPTRRPMESYATTPRAGWATRSPPSP